MEQKHRDILRTSFAYLIKNLHNVDEICDYLVSYDILTAGMVDSIKHKTPKPTAQVRELLSILPRRGKTAYRTFVDALIETNNKDAADFLELKENPKGGSSQTDNKFSSKEPDKSKDETGDVQKAETVTSSGPGTTRKQLESSNQTTNNNLGWPDLKGGISLVQQNHIIQFDEINLKEFPEKFLPEKVYNLFRKKKGKFLLISNVNCGNWSEKQETDAKSSQGGGSTCDFSGCTRNLDFDKSSMQQLFTYMGFDAGQEFTVKSVKKQEMIDFLKGQVDQNESYSSLVVLIMSGGENCKPGEIYDKDHEHVPKEEILSIIRESTAFKGKPKVVIIRTCNFTEPKESYDSLDAVGGPVLHYMCKEPNKDDLFVVSAQPKACYSPWIKGEHMTGSYFIQALVHVFKNQAHEKSFMDLMEEVNKCLANARVPEMKDGKNTGKESKVAVGEVMIIEYCTEKKLYLFPGFIDEHNRIWPQTWPNLKKGGNSFKKKDIKHSTWEFHDDLKKSGKEYYPLTGPKKGKVLMISNINCSDVTDKNEDHNTCSEEETERRNKCRSHIDFDNTNMNGLLKAVGFECRGADQIKNKTKEEVMKWLKEKIQAIDDDPNVNYASLILVIFSGKIDCEPSKIYDYDGNIIAKSEILKVIRDSKHFKGKPKIVIMQSYSFKEKIEVPDNLDSGTQKVRYSKEPNQDDLFVVSTNPVIENGPWMIGENMTGSYFLQAFIHVFTNQAHGKSFLEMMEEVNSYLSNAVVPEVDQDGKYIEDKISHKIVGEVLMLEHSREKDLYFFPMLPEAAKGAGISNLRLPMGNVNLSVSMKAVTQPVDN